jgi:hypothetical protein
VSQLQNLLAAATIFLALHNVDGDEIVINVEQIVALYPTHEAAEGKPNTLMAGGLKCVIALSDGKRVSVVEQCSTIRQSIQQHQDSP